MTLRWPCRACSEERNIVARTRARPITRRTGLSTFTMVPLSVPWADSGQPAIDRPLGDSEGEWLLYTQPRIDEQTRRAAAGRTMMWPSTASMVSVRSLSDPRGPKERVSYTALASTPVEI